jgi:hypothetical protein
MAGSVMVVNEPEIVVVIVEAGNVIVETAVVVDVSWLVWVTEIYVGTV